MSKRYDPRMHSAEHILNQTMDRLFGTGRCISAHIEKKKSKCDYRIDRSLNRSEIQMVENQVNNIIQADLPITERLVSLAEASKYYDRKRLPDDVGNTIRIVDIGDYDSCPCIGDHVRSTGEIGKFRITSVTYDQGRLRIRYKLR